MEIIGTIIQVMPAQSGVSQRTGNPWMSQEYLLQTDGQYPKKCIFRVFGEDRIKQFNIQQGEHLTAMIDIDAHDYNGRWYPEITCYNVSRGQQVQQPAQQPQYQQQAPQPQYQQPAPQQFPPQVNAQGQAQYQPAPPAPQPAPTQYQTQAQQTDLPF